MLSAKYYNGVGKSLVYQEPALNLSPTGRMPVRNMKVRYGSFSIRYWTRAQIKRHSQYLPHLTARPFFLQMHGMFFANQLQSEDSSRFCWQHTRVFSLQIILRAVAHAIDGQGPQDEILEGEG